jgi:prepilin signal peptidase PulO-like enzyme (type II secretory pathway)
MDMLFGAFVLVFGAVIGSFLNAVVWRLRTGQSFVRGRSACPHCGHGLGPGDLVPLLSFAFLRGRCRYCHGRISWQYPAAEAAVAAAFLAAAWRLAPPDGAWTTATLSGLLFAWGVIAVMTVVFIYDLKYMLILRSVTWPAAVLAVLANLALGMDWRTLAIGCIVGYGFFWLQFRFSDGRWIGGGDLDLGLLMGAILGWQKLLVAFWFAYVIGALYAVVTLAAGRRRWHSQIPFGTFLAVGTLVALLFGSDLIRRYFGFGL